MLKWFTYVGIINNNYSVKNDNKMVFLFYYYDYSLTFFNYFNNMCTIKKYIA